MTTVTYYKETGSYKPLHQLLIISAVLAINLFLGFGYSLLMKIIPFPYFNVAICFVTTSILYAILMAIIRVFKLRNAKQKVHIIWIMTLSFYYFTWIAFLVGAFYEGLGIDFDPYLHNLFIPFEFDAMSDLLAHLYQYGHYRMGSIPVNGLFLVFTWIIEAAILMTLPLLLYRKSQPQPYSNLLNKWYSKYTLYEDYESLFDREIGDKIAPDPVAFIGNLNKGSAGRGSKIHIYYLESDPHAYLNLERFSRPRNDPSKINTRVLVNNLQIPSNVGKQIIDTYHGSIDRGL